MSPEAQTFLTNKRYDVSSLKMISLIAKIKLHSWIINVADFLRMIRDLFDLDRNGVINS